MRNKHLSQHLSVSNLFVFSLTILVQRREHVQCYFNNCSYDILQSMCSSNTNKCLPSCRTSWRRTDLYDLDSHILDDSLGHTRVCRPNGILNGLAKCRITQTAPYNYVSILHRDSSFPTPKTGKIANYTEECSCTHDMLPP